MNSYTYIGLLIAAGFIVAIAVLWGKGDDQTAEPQGPAPTESGKPEPANPPAPGPNAPKPTPPGPAPLPNPIPAPGPVKEPEPRTEKPRNLFNPEADAVNRLVDRQDKVVPWHKKSEVEESRYRSYTVETTQSVYKIAEDVWGDSGKWREIVKHNADTLVNLDRVPRGTVLRIPKSVQKTKRLSLLDGAAEDPEPSSTKLSDGID